MRRCLFHSMIRHQIEATLQVFSLHRDSVESSGRRLFYAKHLSSALTDVESGASGVWKGGRVQLQIHNTCVAVNPQLLSIFEF